MKNLAMKAITGMVCALLGMQASAEGQSKLISRATLKIFPGNSYWDLAVQPEQSLSAFGITVGTQVGCGNLRYRIDYQEAESRQWLGAIWERGAFQTRGAPLRAIRVWLTNPAPVLAVVCDFSLYGTSLSDPVPNDPSRVSYRYAGILEYAGGFALKQGVAFAEGFMARDLHVLIPPYCDGVEVIDVSILVDGRPLAATKVDQKTWSFPAAQGFDRVQLTVNGPEGKACKIPVYVYSINPQP